MSINRILRLASVVVVGVIAAGCQDLPWPESPLYEPPVNDPDWIPPENLEEAMRAVSGHYAHYDVVAYLTEDVNGDPLRTFIISYGFTDLFVEGGALIERDEFCHAEHKTNRPIRSTFDDAATQAIEPRLTEVSLFREEDTWKIWRPDTPTLIGIDGDPDLPLSTDPNDPNINDDDGDGKPGVTVRIAVAGIIQAELYIARREIFAYDLALYSDASLHGSVVDHSEQLVIDSTHDFLNRPNNPGQYPDLGLSPIRLIPIDADLDTCDELMAHQDELFPPEPEF